MLLSGMVFLDIVFTDLPHAPWPGHEVWAGGMGSSPGGIANLAMATARLDLRTSLAAAFSEDGYGHWCRDVLGRQERVDLSLSCTIPDWHSPVTVSMAYDGDRAMVTHGHDAPVSTTTMLGDHPPVPRAVITELDRRPLVGAQPRGRGPGVRRRGLGPDRGVGPRRAPPAHRLPRLHARTRWRRWPTPAPTPPPTPSPA